MASNKNRIKNRRPLDSLYTRFDYSSIGFNASHSIGAMLIAAFYVPLAIFHMDVISGSWWFSSLGIIVGFAYLFLAKKYWFSSNRPANPSTF